MAVATATNDEALHVGDLGLGDAPDAAIAQYAQAHGLVLVTRDLDFADVRVYPPGDFPGLVVLRLSDTSTAGEIRQVLRRFLLLRDVVERLPGHLAIVDADWVRVRPALE